MIKIFGLFLIVSAIIFSSILANNIKFNSNVSELSILIAENTAFATVYCWNDDGDVCVAYGHTFTDCDECSWLANDNCGEVQQE